eukprot:gene30258-35244_t
MAMKRLDNTQSWQIGGGVACRETTRGETALPSLGGPSSGLSRAEPTSSRSNQEQALPQQEQAPPLQEQAPLQQEQAPPHQRQAPPQEQPLPQQEQPLPQQEQPLPLGALTAAGLPSAVAELYQQVQRLTEEQATRAAITSNPALGEFRARATDLEEKIRRIALALTTSSYFKATPSELEEALLFARETATEMATALEASLPVAALNSIQPTLLANLAQQSLGVLQCMFPGSPFAHRLQTLSTLTFEVFAQDNHTMSAKCSNFISKIREFADPIAEHLRKPEPRGNPSSRSFRPSRANPSNQAAPMDRNLTIPPPHSDPNICRTFLNTGHCRFGDRCIYQHIAPPPTQP